MWTHGHANLLNFIGYLNSVHPTIKFTLEDSYTSGQVTFLDTLVKVDRQNFTYSTELYIEPNRSGIIIHQTSSHPMATKKAVIRSEFLRAMRVSSNAAASSRSCQKIQELFEANGYSKQLVRRLHREVTQPYRGDARVHRQRPEQRICDKSLDGYLTLPYIDEGISAKVKSIVRRSGLNIRVAWRSKNTLKSVLTRSAFSPPQCPAGTRLCNACEAGLKGRCSTSGVVYKITCVLYEGRGETITYVGETKRPVRLRFNEHLRDAINKTPDTPIGDHFMTTHADFHELRGNIPLSVEIIQKTTDHPHRKICESIHIRRLKPALSRNIASWHVM